MDKRYIVPGGTSPNTSWSKSHSFLRHPIHGDFQIVNPQSNMIQWWDMHLESVWNDTTKDNQSRKEKCQGVAQYQFPYQFQQQKSFDC
jgi:hypothetical protein